MKKVGLIACISLFLLFFSISEAATVYNFQGKLTDKTGKAKTAKINITFRIFKTATGGTPVWTEQKEVIPDSQGRMVAKLGETTALNLAPANYYVEVQIGSEILTPRRITYLFSLAQLERLKEKYERFLRDNPAVRGAIVWQNYADDPRLYYYDADWTPEMKNGLFSYLLIYETGGTYPYSGPPEPQAGSTTHDTVLSPRDSWQLYLANIAFSLYVEVNRLTAWSITTYSPEQLAPLFDNREIFGRWGTQIFFHEATAWNPKFCYDFLIARSLIKREPRETIKAFTGWTRKYIVHQYTGGGFDSREYYSYNGAPPVDRILTPRWPGRFNNWESQIHGCMGTTALFKAVLRSVNIPVIEAGFGRDDYYHSRCIFLISPVSIGVIHSDVLHTANPFGVYYVDTGQLFLTKADLESSYSNPPLTPEQALHNYGRWTDLLKYYYPSDTYVVQRTYELEGHEEGRLLRELTTVSPTPGSYAGYLTVEEANNLIRRIDAIIAYRGGPAEYRRAVAEYQRVLYSTPP